MSKLTKAQKHWLDILHRDGFVERGYSFGTGQKNRPLEKLCDLGLATFGFGPKDSF